MIERTGPETEVSTGASPIKPLHSSEEDSQKSKQQLLQEVAALRQQVSEFQALLNQRQVDIQKLTDEKTELESKFEEQTAALRESNSSLVSEIVERRQVEEALRGAKDQLQAILDAVPGIVSWISSDLRYLGVNRYLAETFNMPMDAFIGQDIGFLHTGSDFNKFIRDFFADSRQDAYIELPAQVSGVDRRFLIVAQKYNHGQAAFLVGIDITERTRAEEAVRQAEGKYRNIFENTVEGIFQTTPDGRYLSANPALARIYGYDSPAEMMANITSIQQQLYVDSNRREEFIRTLHEQGSIRGFESEIYRKDGGAIWISENARAVWDSENQLLYYEGTVEDITDRKEAEAALKQAKEELEQRVARRTAALTEANQRLLTEIRERHRIEDALRGSEAELRALFAAMTDVITVFDAEGRYLNIVSTNSELLYSPTTERIGRTIYDVLPPYQASLFMRLIQQALNTKNPVRLLEYSLPIGDWKAEDQRGGEAEPDDFENTAWYTAIISPMPDSRVIWVARDITERRRADLALQQAEEKYRSIFENVAEGIFQAAPEDGYLSVNPSLARMYGYASATELMQKVKHIDQLYVDRTRRRELLETLEKEGSVFEFESQIYRADGWIIWISENIRVVRNSEGKLLYYEGTVADITQRKQAEEALRESQRALATLMGNLAGMAYRCIRNEDANWVIEFVSDGCFELTGYQPNQLLKKQGVSFKHLTHSDDRAAVETQIWSAMRKRNPFQLTYRIVTASGEEKWVLEKGGGVVSATGELIAVEGFVTDITDRKRAEEALLAEQEKSERLLLNILPQAIAEELKQNPGAIAYRFEEATILFADIVNFTMLSASIPPSQLVDLLNRIFSTFDQLAEYHGLEKIKTVGDAYMVVGGLPNPMEHHLEAIAEMALAMQQAIGQFTRDDGRPFCLRIGIAIGPVVAGVIGIKKFSYDLWGDAVNVASRMESQGVSERIQVTAAVYERLKYKYTFTRRGVINVKGKGDMTTYWLMGRA